MNIKEILRRATDEKASDVHIVVGLPPILRISTQLMIMKDYGNVTDEQAGKMLEDIANHSQIKTFKKHQDSDFSTAIDGGTRFRVNAHLQKGSIALAFRVIQSNIPDLDSLGLPAKINELTKLPRGLVLVTGPTGSGKSTTMASMINKINENHAEHIITIEDPVEYDMTSNCSVIEQREIGRDCPNFASGIRHALRQDPDVILVGEMRDLETTCATITAAETGHLVFSTLHTNSAAQTIERIIDMYPSTQQGQIRSMLANTLQAVISQTLIKRTDQQGMVACAEIMLCNSAVRNCIREGRVFEIANILETGVKFGMQSMDRSIAQKVSQGIITEDDAFSKTTNPDKMQQLLNHEKTLQPV
jgi:twitching motility protein PilT